MSCGRDRARLLLLLGVNGSRISERSGPSLPPQRTSPLRYPGQAQTLKDALASGKVGRIIAHCVGAVGVDSETGVEHEARFRDGPRLIWLAEQRQGSSEKEMCVGEIAVGFEAPTKPSHRLGVGIEQQLRVAGEHHPLVSEDIARGDAKRLKDMGLGFL